MFVTPVYCTREQVKRALDVAETARSNSQIDRAIGSAKRTVESTTRRRFYPWTGTRYFDWPQKYSRSWRLWLGPNEVISVDSIVSGGVTLDPEDYILRRSDGRDEPPYTSIEINLARSASLQAAATHQRAIEVMGVYGHSADESPAGTLAAALASTTAATATVSDSTVVGVGSLIRIGSERMIVSGRSMADTGQNLGGNLTALNNGTLVAVSSGAAFSADEVILIDAERMLVEDVAGNNLIVRRGWDGSTLAAHTSGADVYAGRALTVRRGVLGTEAATHAQADAVAVHEPPELVRDFSLALALNQLLQERSGYARVSGSGDHQKEFTGRGLKELRADVMRAYRRLRVGAV
ncbi:hypothetical protein Aph01nite_13160 [Acrocarpospora phusangensis]|uniref:Uncharacterized protein n=1 Tax=Acrocarpospora phusangensis TaxID=1070424 RepID=A0A919Q6E6_9ACTN|nr:hypothetical protein [Acrocarpospora phusangensis]GIH23006.1 hypothetical protein Aph01nite_13160 [Acrocarpospora phusangensis]